MKIRRQTVSFTMEPDMIVRLEKLVEESKMPLSAYIRERIIKPYILEQIEEEKQ